MRGLEVLNSNLVVLGNYWGQIELLDLQTMKIKKSKTFKEFDYIVNIKKTKNANEVAILTEDKGLRFLKINKSKTENPI